MARDTHDALITSIRQIIRAVDIHSKVLLKNYGMTGPQLTILKAINESKDLSVSEIAANISLSQATVTTILSRLEQQGYITRRRGNADKRKVYVEISEKTRSLLSGTPSLLRKDFLERFYRLEDWEQSLLLSSLQRIAAMMNAVDDDPSEDDQTGDDPTTVRSYAQQHTEGTTGNGAGPPLR